jgi:hypothetical protein
MLFFKCITLCMGGLYKVKESTGNDSVVAYLNFKENREISAVETGIEPWNCITGLQITNGRWYIASLDPRAGLKLLITGGPLVSCLWHIMAKWRPEEDILVWCGT